MDIFAIAHRPASDTARIVENLERRHLFPDRFHVDTVRYGHQFVSAVVEMLIKRPRQIVAEEYGILGIHLDIAKFETAGKSGRADRFERSGKRMLVMTELKNAPPPDLSVSLRT